MTKQLMIDDRGVYSGVVLTCLSIVLSAELPTPMAELTL